MGRLPFDDPGKELGALCEECEEAARKYYQPMSEARLGIDATLYKGLNELGKARLNEAKGAYRKVWAHILKNVANGTIKEPEILEILVNCCGCCEMARGLGYKPGYQSVTKSAEKISEYIRSGYLSTHG